MKPETPQSFLRDETFATVTASVIVICQWWIMADLHVRLQWAIPLAATTLLTATIFMLTMPDRGDNARRGLQLGLVVLLIAANLINLLELAGQALFDRPSGAIELLLTGFVLWVMNVLVFALAYWLIDGGGPKARNVPGGFQPDWVFPQQSDPDNAPPNWRAMFGDYLYLAFTGAIAFGPTDAMPFSRIAKITMTVEAGIALATLGVIIARAVALAN